MAERPQNYDKWKDLNAKIGDYLRSRGFDTGNVDFESGWLGILRVEFGLGRDAAISRGFTRDELDQIDNVLNKAQAELDRRTSFYRGDSISGQNPYATPESEVRRRCQERLGNLDNIIHMWDILAIIGVARAPGAVPPSLRSARPKLGVERASGPGTRSKPSRKEKPRFDLFHSLRDSTSSAAISSMEAQRAHDAYEAFADTAQQDISLENKPEPALSDAKTGNYVKPQQSKSPGEPGGPGIGKGPVTEPPLSQVFSKKFLGEFGRPWGDKAARIGLGEKDLKLLMDLGIKDRALLERIESALEKGGGIRQKIQTEMKMLHYLKDNLCGGSIDRTRTSLQAGDDVWGAVSGKNLDNVWKEWRARQTDKDVLIKMSRKERNRLASSLFDEARAKTNQIIADISGPKIPEVQTQPGKDAIPPKIGETPPPSADKTPPGEANIPGSKGPEVQTPPGGANLPPELKNPRSEQKPPPREEPKPPSIPLDLEMPPEFPIILPTREPGSETLPNKEPQSIQPPGETPQIDGSDNPSQSVAPGKETFPMEEPECISPPSETPPLQLPPLPSESISWASPSENLPPPSESSSSASGDYSGSYGQTEPSGDSGKGSGKGQESGGGDAGIVEGGGGGETGAGEGGI